MSTSNIKNLGDLPADSKIDDILEESKVLGESNQRPKTEDINMKPLGAARVKLTIEYNQEKKKYVLSEDDKSVFYRYDIDLN